MEPAPMTRSPHTGSPIAGAADRSRNNGTYAYAACYGVMVTSI